MTLESGETGWSSNGREEVYLTLDWDNPSYFGITCRCRAQQIFCCNGPGLEIRNGRDSNEKDGSCERLGG